MNKETITDIAKSHGAVAAGIAEARIYSELIDTLLSRGVTPFVKHDIYKRINPFLIMPDAQSILACAFPYMLPNSETAATTAKYAAGGDYHPYVKGKLRGIAASIAAEAQHHIDTDFHYKAIADSGSLCERHIAYLSGIGFFGRNNLLYTRTHGSLVYLGLLLLNLPLAPDSPMQNRCLGCNSCIQACPTGAIGKNHSFNPYTCLSYLTQAKEELTPQQTNLLSLAQYSLGCDICADVCPLNT